MTSPQYTLTPLSYSLPILHAAAHPSSTVLGVFLSPPNQTEIDEAIPLIHTHTTLSPITEVSLSLVEEYCKLRNKRIVGIYIARELGEGLGRVGERILGALREKLEDIFGLVLDNDKLSKGQFAYIPYIPTSSATFKPLPSSESFTIKSSSTDLPSKLLQIIRAKKIHRNIRDFDDNLEDPDADWLENALVKNDIQKYLS
ncbi:hypothetical protein V865_000319 [Kwoniella europaea PYCC6329]|uniref:MPN domain-containing protein n=1 Tax=Kwoniella europaea PYCC6329 TaxID=1423913 RepID=A0AAX4K9I0_9TREE